jgi:hypothetical protein
MCRLCTSTHTVITRSQILAVRADASHTGRWPDSTMVDACNVCLWELDGNGMLRGFYSHAGDRVRAAVDARLRTGELFPHA